MATRNNINTGLSGVSGTGSYAGSTSASFSSVNIGAATATSLNIGSTITLDKFINDSTFATASTTSGATSSSIKTYVDGLVASGNLIQYIIGTSTTDDSTTSTTMQSSSLSASITPGSTSNKIVVMAYVPLLCYRSAGTIAERSMNLEVYRSSGTPSVLMASYYGSTLISTNSNSADQYHSCGIIGYETAPATSSQTYLIRYNSSSSGNVTASIQCSSLGTGKIYLLELKV